MTSSLFFTHFGENLTLTFDFDQKALAEKEKGNAAYKAKDFPTAITHYEKAWELDATNITFLTNKAGMYLAES